MSKKIQTKHPKLYKTEVRYGSTSVEYIMSTFQSTIMVSSMLQHPAWTKKQVEVTSDVPKKFAFFSV